MQIAVITRRSDGFYLSQVEGMDCPLINGYPVSLHGQRVDNKDVNNIAGTQTDFLSLAEPFLKIKITLKCDNSCQE